MPIHPLRRAFLVVVFLAAALPTRAQVPGAELMAATGGPGEIEGIVVASESGRPLAGAAVRIRTLRDSGVVASVVANANGHFRVRGLPVGRYLVRASSLGYAPSVLRRAEVTGGAPRVELGTVALTVAPVAVRPLEVAAGSRGVLLAPDRTIYSAAILPAAAGGTAVDLLRQIPELEVAPDGIVTLRGSTSVAIQLNGRPAAAQGEALRSYLQQLPAARIERVEVAPNPSARSDAEGMAGIVNIVLREAPDQGASGSVSAYTGTNSAGTYAGLARQRGALSLFGSASLSGTRSRTGNSDLRENLLAQPVTYLEQTGSTANRGRSAIVDAGAELRPRARVSAWATLTGTAWRYDGDGRMAYALRDSALLSLDRFQQLGSGGNVRRSGDVVAGARWSAVPQRHELALEARASGGDDGVNARYTREPLDAGGLPLSEGDLRLLNTTEGSDRQLSLQADYIRPAGTNGRLEAGLRILDRRSENQMALTLFPPPGLMALAAAATVPGGYLFREQYRSGYLTLRQRLRTVTVQGGVRVEEGTAHFRPGSTGRSYDTQGIDVFPSASLILPAGAGRQLRLAYSKRVERPIAYLLNPDLPVTDSLNRIEGNPTLQPKYTHNLTADLTWSGRPGTVRLAPYYRRVVDNWDQVKRVDVAGAAVLTWENVASVTSYGATATGWLSGDRRLGGYLSLGVYRELRDADNISPEFSGSAVRLSASANGSLKATPALTLQATGFYSPARDIPQGRISSTVLTSVAARRTLGRQARVHLSCTDPFGIWHYDFRTRDQTHIQTSRNSFSMRALTLYLSYSFGRRPQETRGRSSSEPPQPQADVRIH